MNLRNHKRWVVIQPFLHPIFSTDLPFELLERQGWRMSGIYKWRRLFIKSLTDCIIQYNRGLVCLSIESQELGLTRASTQLHPVPRLLLVRWFTTNYWLQAAPTPMGLDSSPELPRRCLVVKWTLNPGGICVIRDVSKKRILHILTLNQTITPTKSRIILWLRWDSTSPQNSRDDVWWSSEHLSTTYIYTIKWKTDVWWIISIQITSIYYYSDSDGTPQRNSRDDV